MPPTCPLCGEHTRPSCACVVPPHHHYWGESCAMRGRVCTANDPKCQDAMRHGLLVPHTVDCT